MTMNGPRVISSFVGSALGKYLFLRGSQFMRLYQYQYILRIYYVEFYITAYRNLS